MRAGGPWALLVLAAAVRAVVALRTEIPGRDAASYLWMAEQVAAGRIEAAFETVFHPVYSLLVAGCLWLAPGLGAVAAGQVVASGMGALAVLPLWALAARVFDRHAANAAGFLYAVGIWFARHPADCLSEGPFYLWVCTALWLLCVPNPVPTTGAEHSFRCAPSSVRSGRAFYAGILAGLAFGTRPEGAAIAVLGATWLLGGRDWRSVVWLAIGFLLAALPWPLGYALLGEGLTVTPKLAFNYAVGVGAESAGVGHYFDHLRQLPHEMFEALGYVATPMVLAGLWIARPWRQRSVANVVLLLFLLQIAVIPLLRSHFRFMSGYGAPMLIFAGAAWSALRPRWVGWPVAVRALVVVAAVGGDLIRIPQARREDRIVLRELGHHLRARLAPGETIASDMPRLDYYAGIEPGPPRPIFVRDIVDACNSPRTRYAVVVAPRTPVTSEDLGSEFEEISVPELEELIAARSIRIWRRMP